MGDAHPVVWTWRIDEGLCYVTHVDPKFLGAKPSPEAKKVRVRLVPIADYNRMVRARGEQP